MNEEFELFRKLLKSRSKDEYYYVMLWEQETKAFSKDINKTIDFVLHYITDEELFWMSEVFYDIYGKTKSLEFMKAIQERVKTIADDEIKKEVIIQAKYVLLDENDEERCYALYEELWEHYEC